MIYPNEEADARDVTDCAVAVHIAKELMMSKKI